jgi:hypothetical protein
MRKVSARKRRKLDLEHEKRKDRLRRQFPEIHGKLIDYVTNSYDDGWLYVTLYFTDGTNFSLDFTVNEPAIVPKLIEFGKYVDGNYVNLRTYLHRKDKC